MFEINNFISKVFFKLYYRLYIFHEESGKKYRGHRRIIRKDKY